MQTEQKPKLLGRRGRIAAAAAACLLTTALVAPALLPATSPAEAALPGVDFSALAQQVLPAVVNVSTTQKVAQAGFQMPNFPTGTPFDDFFKQFGNGQFGHGGKDREVTETALGSGFIIDPDGFIVTNNHVVGDATDIKVTLQDGTEMPAKLIGRDKKTDLALLKVEPKKPLPSVSFAAADEIKVGEAVMAVGNPFGLGGTVTAGIVSARGRDIHSGPFDDYIQTDAAINKGNSGGPLFDMNGHVIGINTAIFSPSGGSVGIGFAIPSTLAQPIVQEIRDKGSVSRGWLGVAIQPLTDDLAASMGLKNTDGALVANVTDDSPAKKAGIESGDVITGVSGQPVKEFRDVARLVAAVPPGTDTKIEVLRNGSPMTVSVDVGKMPNQETASADDNGSPSDTGSYGLALGPITPDVANELNISPDTRGAVIMQVEPGSPAADQGLRPGDVILRVGGRQVADASDAAKALNAAKGDKKPVLVQIERDGSQRFLALSSKAA
ncbi:putative periplasmic serine endoprotease DegP-like precursor [Hartmannibacter diazotrophicus]|uniref:Probable periplasmic serine endoprotease DegP-like n=1 Tax=Hartmannibacter diazotrophicus TaxID=1482074 RepID=A0A2C9CZZ0_9HYPH|nr:DegQ family serine endoprotease [Hartmannibacter diazotrophicus]SON53564.1 putative periplasmic serine endoprotease DegP-like precursor [Hartmannibacter diazotrophicus]